VQDGNYAVHGGMDAVAVRAYMANGAHMMYGRFFMLGMNTIMAAGGGGGNSMVGGPVTGRGNINRLMSIVKMIDLASRAGMFKNSNVIDVIAGLYNSGYNPGDGVGIDVDKDTRQYNNFSSCTYLIHSKGIQVITFKEYNDGRRGGVEIELGYIDGGSGYINFQWVQTITTNDPLGNAKSPYNDPQPPDDDLPFYYTKAELPFVTNKRGFDVIFRDRPKRSLSKDVSWSAELVLVGQKDGYYYPISTLTYGFRIRNGKVQLENIQYKSRPTNFTKGFFYNKKFQ